MGKVLIQYELEGEFGFNPRTVSILVDKENAKATMESLMEDELHDLAQSVGNNPSEIFTILEVEVKGTLTPEELGFELEEEDEE